MRCLTREESRAWCESHGIAMAESGEPVIDGFQHHAHYEFTDIKFYSVVALARSLAWVLQPSEECFLWVTLWSVWGSSENTPLFDRLRGSYGENRPLHESPGLLFAVEEESDLVTFLQIALTSGWNFFLVSSPFRCGVFVSHDEFMEVYARDAAALEPLRSLFEPAK
jgi:hypothetical protein